MAEMALVVGGGHKMDGTRLGRGVMWWVPSPIYDVSVYLVFIDREAFPLFKDRKCGKWLVAHSALTTRELVICSWPCTN